MYPGLVHSHSGLRWVLFILLVMTILRAMGKRNGKTPWADQDRKLALFTLIAAHVQAVIGLSLYAMSTKVDFSATMMSSPSHRFFTMEHTLMMLIAIILITVGYRHAKNGNAKKVFGFYLAALIIILLAIPWPFRTALGAGWF
jgi:uncharacterized membrane protein